MTPPDVCPLDVTSYPARRVESGICISHWPDIWEVLRGSGRRRFEEYFSYLKLAPTSSCNSTLNPTQTLSLSHRQLMLSGLSNIALYCVSFHITSPPWPRSASPLRPRPPSPASRAAAATAGYAQMWAGLIPIPYRALRPFLLENTIPNRAFIPPSHHICSLGVRGF